MNLLAAVIDKKAAITALIAIAIVTPVVLWMVLGAIRERKKNSRGS